MGLAMWQLACGVDLQTKDAVYTLSAMTSGIRRNWIEALRKTVRPALAPDVTKYVLSWTGALGKGLPPIWDTHLGALWLQLLDLSFSSSRMGRKSSKHS